MVKVTLQLSRGHWSTYILRIGDISYFNSRHQDTVVWSPLLALAASVVYPSGEEIFFSSLILSFLSGWRRQWLIAYDDLRHELRSTSTSTSIRLQRRIYHSTTFDNKSSVQWWLTKHTIFLNPLGNSASIWGLPGNKSQKKEITVEKFSLN